MTLATSAGSFALASRQGLNPAGSGLVKGLRVLVCRLHTCKTSFPRHPRRTRTLAISWFSLTQTSATIFLLRAAAQLVGQADGVPPLISSPPHTRAARAGIARSFPPRPFTVPLRPQAARVRRIDIAV